MVAIDRWADSMAAWRPVRIDPSRCLPQISQKAACDACQTICPVCAIRPGEPTLTTCDTCGLCAAICPADAILLDDPSDQQLLQQASRLSARYDRVLFTCEQSSDEFSLRPGCLGRLSPELLLAIAACGFREVDLIASDATCSACPKATGLSLAKHALLEAQSVLDRLGHPCQIRLLPSAPPPTVHRSKGTPPVEQPLYEDRRAFLLSAFGLLRELLPLARPSTQTEPATPATSRRRALLHWALSRFSGERLATADTPWGHCGVELTGHCHHCGICQSLCPNGAITLGQVGQEQLLLDPGRCHTCGLCTRVCPTEALRLGPARSLAAVAAGGDQPLGRPVDLNCARCGSPFHATVPDQKAPSESLCLPCLIRRSSPEEVFLHD